jgi:hypothetical protein
MPDLRLSTLKQRAHTMKSENARIQKHTVRRKPVKSTLSSPSINHALGAMSCLPFEIRQAIFKQIVPAETPPIVPSDDSDIDEASDEDDPTTSSTRGSLMALLCTSKSDLHRSQVYLPESGISALSELHRHRVRRHPQRRVH